MHTHALTVALTLYRSGTLTLDQAAESAGLSDAQMRTALRRHGIAVVEDRVPSGSDRASVGAD
jgi:predicted HTH domain antitoxin